MQPRKEGYEMSDASTTAATAAWINTAEYKELNFARKAW